MRKAEETGSANLSGVEHGLLGRVRLILELAISVCNIGQRYPDLDQPGVVFDFLQERDDLLAHRGQGVDVTCLGSGEGVLMSGHGAGNHLTSMIARGSSAYAHGPGHGHSFSHGWLHEGEMQFQVDIELNGL